MAEEISKNRRKGVPDYDPRTSAATDPGNPYPRTGVPNFFENSVRGQALRIKSDLLDGPEDKMQLTREEVLDIINTYQEKEDRYFSDAIKRARTDESTFTAAVIDFLVPEAETQE